MEKKNINILIVEDEIIASEYLVNILESLSFNNVFEAVSIEKAKSIIKHNSIDLVFMDINIDGSIDGIQGASILNAYYNLPIIFTTAYGDSNTISEAYETNIYGYLIKPFKENNVEATLSVAIKQVFRDKQQLLDYDMNTIKLGKNEKFDKVNKTFYINNIPVHLTKNELNLLNTFCVNIDNNISYTTLKEYVWNNKDISDSNIRDTVSRLKRKAPNLLLENIVNFGYILKSYK